jgi:hypothetical protein
MGRKVKFPVPSDYKPAQPAILCPAERVIDLYNQDSGDEAQKIAKKVRRWFTQQAHARGWAGVHFLPEVQSNNGAGCVLWRPPERINVSITVTKRMLVLSDEPDDDGNV